MNIQLLGTKQVALAPFNAISMALSVLLQQHGVMVTHIFDNNHKVQGKTFRNIPICSAMKVNTNETTVIVCSFISLKQISKQLKRLETKRVMEYEEIVNRDNLDEMLAAFEQIKEDGSLDDINEYHRNVMFGSGDFSIRAGLLPKEAKRGVVLPLATVVLTEACTLNCAECSHFMQYFSKPRTYDKDVISENFHRLYNAVSFIRNLSISGGEPLLHKDIEEIIERLAGYENIGYISLTTNSTILPSEGFFERISKIDNLIIRLSSYGQYSKYIKQIAELCEKYKIRYAVLDNATWYGGLRITELNKDFDEVQHIFQACSTKDMLLAENSFAKCHMALFADKLGATPDDLPGLDGCLDVSAKDFSSDKLKAYLESNEVLKPCSICSGASRVREQVPPAEQAKEKLPYKKYKEKTI